MFPDFFFPRCLSSFFLQDIFMGISSCQIFLGHKGLTFFLLAFVFLCQGKKGAKNSKKLTWLVLSAYVKNDESNDNVFP